MTILTGPVAFIDDEIDETSSVAYQLLEEIRATGRPVAAAADLPDDPEIWFDHWQGLAYIVIDWDLSPGSVGMTGGATLSAFRRKKLYDFIAALMARIYCPIFIVSAENTDSIEQQIAQNPDLHRSDGTLDERIKVFPKDVVLNHLDTHVSQWVGKSPALAALTAWAGEQNRAKNQLFIDLNEGAADWPVYIWQAAEVDQVDPAYELTTAISTNLINRLRPIEFDAELMSTDPQDGSSAARRRVSQGRTTIGAERLSDRMVLPGDIFKFNDALAGEVWINVSPACHTVGRLIKMEADGTEVREPVHLHLLRGMKQTWPKSDGELRNMDSKDRSNSLVLHTVLEGEPYKFVFAEARIESWSDMKPRRVARLLPPFITRLQQLHAAYIQSEGLPRVTLKLYAD
jgi:hypothetical protein